MKTPPAALPASPRWLPVLTAVAVLSALPAAATATPPPTAPPSPAPAAEPDSKFNLSLHYTTTRTTHFAGRRWGLQGSWLHRAPQDEWSGEFRTQREAIALNGSDSTLKVDEIDTFVKWRRDLAALDDPPREGASTYYTYLSPRLRRNRFGYFSSSQAVRAGAGRRFAPLDDLSLSLEFGPGLRLGRARSGENIREGVLTASSQLDYRVSDSTQLRLALMSERSSREHYQTAVTTLRNRVSRHVWLKYELSYRKALPMDTLQPVGETRFDAGISCQF